MTVFNNELYEKRVTSLLNDIFYVNNISNENRLRTLRPYAEICARKILNLEVDSKLTLGVMIKKLQHEDNYDFIRSSFENIQQLGNNFSHSEHLDEPSNDDINNALQSLIKIIAYFFIRFFMKHNFKSDSEIASKFSLLPPIVRVYTLEFLLIKEPKSIDIIEKLSLAILKAKSEKEAISFINLNKDILSKIPIHNSEYITTIVSRENELTCTEDPCPKDMFEYLSLKIKLVGCDIKNKGKLYDSFEDALQFYKKNKSFIDRTYITDEFVDLMDFVYMGRKSS